MRIKNKIALVTGGASGIGEAIVRRLASDGFQVIIADCNPTETFLLEKKLTTEYPNISAIIVDIGIIDSITSVFEFITTTHKRCDVLVNNAGIASTFPFLDYPLNDWLEIMNINLTGTMLMSKNVANLMKANRWGRIINLASISGIRASMGRTAYGTSKAAIIGLTKQIAVELAEFGITANSVAPGPIETPMASALHSQNDHQNYIRQVPMKRYGLPSEVAAVVSFLASEDSSFVTGHTINVDGGFIASGLINSSD